MLLLELFVHFNLSNFVQTAPAWMWVPSEKSSERQGLKDARTLETTKIPSGGPLALNCQMCPADKWVWAQQRAVQWEAARFFVADLAVFWRFPETVIPRSCRAAR
jgi:hypothetical protein